MAKIKTISNHTLYLEAEKELAESVKSSFIVRDLNPIQSAEVYDILFANSSGEFKMSFKSLVKAAQLGLVNWTNVLDEDDKPIKFSKEMVEYLPVHILTEIGLEILKNTFPEFKDALTEQEQEQTDNPLVQKKKKSK